MDFVEVEAKAEKFVHLPGLEKRILLGITALVQHLGRRTAWVLARLRLPFDTDPASEVFESVFFLHLYFLNLNFLQLMFFRQQIF